MSKTAKIIIAVVILFIAGAISVLYAMDFSVVPQTKHVVCDILEIDEKKIVMELKNETDEDYYYTDYYWFAKYDEKSGEQIRLEYKENVKPEFTNEEQILSSGESKTITIYYSDIYESFSDGVYDFKNFGFMYDENGEKTVYPFGGRIEIPFEKTENDPKIDPDLVTVNVLESSDKFIEIEMTNNSNMVMVYDESYHIETLDSGGWSELTEKEEAFFNLIAYEVMPGKTAEWSAEFEWRYGVLPKGKYRLAKDIRFENDMGEECAAQRIYAEFEVE